MTFDRCIKVKGNTALFVVREEPKTRVRLRHWANYVALGEPAIVEVTQAEADEYETVLYFGQEGTGKTSPVLVVIPTLNRRKWCRRAIESLLQQKYTDWNLIIAKNGGLAHTKAYIDDLADVLDDPRIKMLVLPDVGLGYALNEALFHYGQDYKYFANLEDDDEWDTGFLSTMVKALDNSKASVAHCLQRQLPCQKQSNGGPMDKHTITRRNWINFPMCLFRTRILFKAHGFCNEAGPATDWDIHLRCLQAGARYQYVARTLVTHHWHDRNYCLADSQANFIRDRIKQGVYS